MKIVAVGERCHWPEVTPAVERTLTTCWKHNPIGSSKNCGAFENGYGRLNALGFNPDFALNLLSPRADMGKFDVERARKVAREILMRAAEQDWDLALLGRRVCDMFTSTVSGRRLEFGEIRVLRIAGHWITRALRPVQVIGLPHPSGRSRYLNDETARKYVRNRIEVFQCRAKVTSSR